jgi:hypothetical protein
LRRKYSRVEFLIIPSVTRLVAKSPSAKGRFLGFGLDCLPKVLAEKAELEKAELEKAELEKAESKA